MDPSKVPNPIVLGTKPKSKHQEPGFTMVVVILLLALATAGGLLFRAQQQANKHANSLQDAQRQLEEARRSADNNSGVQAGLAGPQGPQGEPGQTGTNGSAGANGRDGSSGSIGSTGAAGEKGQDGATGQTGPAGPQGPTGSTGVVSCPNGTCVSLQGSLPGVIEAGNINISGTLIAGTFSGSGGSLTGLNASNIATGTLGDARLSSSVTLQGNTFNGGNQLVQLTAGGLLPALNGSNLTNVAAASCANCISLQGSTPGSPQTGNLNISGSGIFGGSVGIGTNPSYKLDVAGDVRFQNATNSTTAFQVLNTSSQSLLTVDTTNSAITLSGNNSGELSAWSTNANSLPAIRAGHTSVSANGYVYAIGGYGSAYVNTVYYARLNTNGSVGTWSTNVNALPANISDGMSVTANGYVYHIGGESGGSALTAVYYAKLNADGSTGTWSTNANTLPAGRKGAGAVVANGYVYIIGGSTGTGVANATNTVYSAKINADGSLGAWTSSANVLPAVRSYGGSIVANGYVYVLAGHNGTTYQTAVYYSRVGANGTVGAWSTAANTIPAGRGYVSVAQANGYAYILGGTNGSSYFNSVYYARLNADGTTGTWVTSTSVLPNGPHYNTSVVVNGYIYVIGGGTSSGYTSTVYYASSSRLKVGGSVDLVGLGGQNMAEGGTGGSLTAGNGTFVGTLQVQDATTLSGNLTTEKDLRVSGAGVFRNTADSTSAFQVQNAAGSSIISVDSTTSNVAVGTSDPGTFRLLVSSATTGGFRVVNTGTPGAGGGAGLQGVSADPTAADQRLGLLIFGSNGVNATNAIAINGYSEEAYSSGARGSYITFDTVNIGATSRTEKVRLSANGNLGIGTGATVPEKLTVSGNASFSGSIIVGGKFVGNTSTRGTVTISSGATTATVTFGSAYASAPNVVVTPTGNPGAHYWVSGVSTTGFTVNLASAPGTNVTFNWQAQQ